MVTSGKKSGFEMTEQEKIRAKKLLDELNEIGPEGLPNWNIRAHTFIVFMAARNPTAIFEINR